MTINKVIFGGETLVDLTNDTVSTDTLAKGVTAHDKTGVQITGTMEFGGHQIFEIFQSLRKDETDIDGAYPCDGREFSKSDFSGGNNPYDMLVLNKAKTLSYEEWNTEVTAKGVCFSFALDEENEKFKIPKLINDTIPTLTGTVGDVGKSDVANTGSGRNIGETVFSLIPITDAGLHLLDGSLLQVGGIYDSFITHVASLQTAYPGLFTTETAWQASVSAHGVCGKFVYTEGVSLRIPKITGFIEGTLDATALGSLVEAGLPNITGYSNIAGVASKAAPASGCLEQNRFSLNNDYQAIQSSVNDFATVSLNAALSNPIYGKSTTVQPQAIKGYLYMVVATATKTDIQVNIDNITTDLNGKAGTDLSNLSTVGKTAVAHLGMPSSSYVDLTYNGHGSMYTAIADGYVLIHGYGSEAPLGINVFGTDGSLICKNTTQGYLDETSDVGVSVSVAKGQTFSTFYYGGTVTKFRFTYAEGSKP